jgi:prevent-host-death family protein
MQSFKRHCELMCRRESLARWDKKKKKPLHLPSSALDSSLHNGNNVHISHSTEDPMSIDIVNFRNRMSDTINRVAYQGERTVLTRHGKGVAALVPVEDFALLEKLEDEADIKAARAALRESGEIPWEQVKRELGLRGLGRGGTAGTQKSARPKRTRAKAGR